MPRECRGRARSTPAGRASPQAPAGLVAEKPLPSLTLHTLSSNLQPVTNSHASQTLLHDPPVNTTEQPPRYAQNSTTTPEGPPAAREASGWSPSYPVPVANDCNPDRRSVAQPTLSTVGHSHAVDLQLRSSPGTTNNRKSLAESGKQLGYSSKQQAAGQEPNQIEQVADLHCEVPSFSLPRPSPFGQLESPT